MFLMLLSIIGCLVGLIGWFVKKSAILLLIGFALTMVEKIAEWKNYNAGARKTEILIFAIGCIIGFFTRVPFWVGGLIASLIYDLVISFFGFVMLIMAGSKIK